MRKLKKQCVWQSYGLHRDKQPCFILVQRFPQTDKIQLVVAAQATLIRAVCTFQDLFLPLICSMKAKLSHFVRSAETAAVTLQQLDPSSTIVTVQSAAFIIIQQHAPHPEITATVKS